jgi:RNA polymerase sigma-70 factor (ECF subfamily)
MSKRGKETTMGRAKNVFQTTRWSEILDAKTPDEIRRKAVVGNLMQRYWKPIYCYLRHKGHNNEIAKDLTQGFFYEIVLGRELIQQADKAKGRFRTFLLTSLDRYEVSVHRKETAKKRLPIHGLIELDTTVIPDLDSRLDTNPEQIFHYAWAVDLLDQILRTVKKECFETGKSVYWEVFHAKLVAPIVENIEPPSLENLCKKYHVEDEVKASNMIITVKRRFVAVLKRFLRQYVQSDSRVEDEFRDLLGILSKGSAG